MKTSTIFLIVCLGLFFLISVVLSITLLFALNVVPVPGGFVRSALPAERPVDAEKFIANFGCWASISNFMVVQENEFSPYMFTVDCEFEIDERSNTRDATSYAWIVEIYSKGELVYILDTQTTLKSGVLVAKVPFRETQHGPLEFFTYVACVKASTGRIPVSGILTTGSARTSEHPVAIERKKNIKPMIELTNPRIYDVNQDYDELACDFKIVDESFRLDYSPAKYRKYSMFVNIENEFGQLTRFYGLRVFDEDSGEIRVNNRWKGNSSSSEFLTRFPCKIYLTRESPSDRSSREVGYAQTQTLFSNVLEVDKRHRNGD